MTAIHYVYVVLGKSIRNVVEVIMIVYLEGVDGTGKTTLSNAILAGLKRVEKLKNLVGVGNCEPVISTRPDKPGRISSKNLFQNVMNWAMDMDHVFILDRGPISDCIYRVFDDYEPVVNLKETLRLFKLIEFGTVIVHCDTDISEQKMLERGDDNPVAIARHKDIRRLYKTVMPLFDAHTYDYEKQDKTKYADKLTTILLGKRRAYHITGGKTK